MSSIFYTEYRNQNEARNYPLDDLASMLASDGRVLPSDFLIDASICVIKYDGIPYIKSINVITGKIVIGSDSGEYGYADFDGVSDRSMVYDYTFDRPIGVLVYGDAGRAFNMQTNYTFRPETTRFAPSAWFELKQKGVRGFLLEDGTLVTGKVKFEGRKGVETVSYYLSTAWFTEARSTLAISAKGELPIQPDIPAGEGTPGVAGIDCLGTPIKSIKVITSSKSLLRASDYEKDIDGNSYGIIALSAYGFTAEDLCEQNRMPREDGKPFNYKDICDPDTVSISDPDAPKTFTEFVMVPAKDTLAILAPSTLTATNPIVVTTVKSSINQIFMAPTESPAKTPNAIQVGQKYLANNPGSVMIGFKGLKR